MLGYGMLTASGNNARVVVMVVVTTEDRKAQVPCEISRLPLFHVPALGPAPLAVRRVLSKRQDVRSELVLTVS